MEDTSKYNIIQDELTKELSKLPDNEIIKLYNEIPDYYRPTNKIQKRIDNVLFVTRQSREKGYFKDGDTYLIYGKHGEPYSYSFSKLEDLTCPISREYDSKKVVKQYTLENIARRIIDADEQTNIKQIRQIVDKVNKRNNKNHDNITKSKDNTEEL